MRQFYLCSYIFSITLSLIPTVLADTLDRDRDQIKVLIVDGFNNHDWKATTKDTKEILSASNLFTVEVSTAPEKQSAQGWDNWRPQFAKYDVVIQNCNSYGNRPSWPKQVQEDLEQYVDQGGGLFVLHSANNAFPEWDEYNKMIGLGWRDKDFGASITISDDGEIITIPSGEGESTSHGKKVNALITSLGNHPIHKGLPKQWMAAELEIYSYARGPAKNLSVISYAREPKTKLNFPIEWVVQYGEGNVYVSTFGHVWRNKKSPPAMRCIAFHTALIRATEWLGSGKVSYPIPANHPDEHSIQLK
ncbi:ThuA domain-containing protein [Akkermansiaceae bacterium]|nr:ThuA domain-containing protein [Akkermansiaceae bacterium]